MSSSAASDRPRIAVLGLGRMGAAMAARLTGRGQDVVGWSRSGRTVPGVTAVSDPGAAVAGAEVVLLCLFDGEACGEVVAQVRDRLAAGTVVVNTSTVAPEEAVALADDVRATGAGYLPAPVIGSLAAVEAGTLTILAGGAYDDPVRSVLEGLGDVLACADAAEAAAAKLLANGTLGSALLAVRDGRHRAAELGMDADRTWTVLERTPLGGLVDGKRPRLESGRFDEADLTIAALAKDLGLLADRAPSAHDVREQVAAALSSGAVLPDDDVAALCLTGAPAAERPHRLSVAPAVTAPPEVLAPLESYVAGHATGDPAHHCRAFLPTAHVEGLRDGRFVSWTVEEYCDLFRGRPADDEADRRRRIDHVTVTGTVGTASMTLWHGPDVFTDAFVLLGVDGEWRIANKVYARATA